jgi:MoaA/NifB/PqqE/SkfB family radical SAM enzyme
MNRQLMYLLRVLFNPRVIGTPLRVFRELRAKGKQRLPKQVEQELGGGVRKMTALRFIRQWLEGEQLSRHRNQWVLNSFLPPFPGRAYDRMFENLLSGRRITPVSAYLAITADCPYACWHCSLQNRRTGHLSTEQWMAGIRELHELGASIIGFTGGEPLSRPDLPELVKAATDGGAETIVFSSGAFMDQEKASTLKRAGLWALCVSLDLPNAHEYDQSRGKSGVYEQAVNALRIARRTGFYTMIGTVATRRLVEERLYQEIYDIACTLGVQELRLVEPMPCGKLSTSPEETFLTPEHIAELRVFHVRTNKRGRLPKICAFNQIESPEIFGCGAGTRHLFIDSAGEVCPCDFTPLSFGNITNTSLLTIWEQMSDAMGEPRRHCFVQRHHRVIAQHAESGYPLTPEQSRKVCQQVGPEPLPDFFAMVASQSG